MQAISMHPLQSAQLPFTPLVESARCKRKKTCSKCLVSESKSFFLSLKKYFFSRPKEIQRKYKENSFFEWVICNVKEIGVHVNYSCIWVYLLLFALPSNCYDKQRVFEVQTEIYKPQKDIWYPTHHWMYCIMRLLLILVLLHLMSMNFGGCFLLNFTVCFQ